MATTLSTAQHTVLTEAANLYLLGTAPENQLHVDVIDRIAPVAVEIGFSASTGAFKNVARDNPITTLLSLAAFIGKP